MPEYLAPGVYVEETSFRAKSIEGVSTSTAGFVGPARYGPVGGLPELITSFAEFQRIFGGLDRLEYEDDDEPTDNYLAHGVRAFFDNGGSRVYVTRIYEPSAPEEDGEEGEEGEDETDRPGHASAGDANLRVFARFPGRAGAARVDLTVRIGGNVLAAVSDGDDEHNVLRGVNPGDVVWLQPPPEPAEGEEGEEAPAGGRLVRAFRYFDAPNGRLNWRLLDDGDEDGAESGEDLQDVEGGVHPVTVDVEVTFLDRAGNTLDVQTWEGLALAPEARGSLSGTFAADLPSRTAELRTPIILDFGDAESGIGFGEALIGALPEGENPAPATGATVRLALANGSDGDRPDGTTYAGTADDERRKTGLAALEDIADVSIVAAPGYSVDRGDADDAVRRQTVTNALISHAERMQYRIAVLDSANGMSIADVRAQRAQVDSTHAALYYPWVRIADPVTRRETLMPPSGFVAGIYARNDVQNGVHKAPANEVVRGALGFELTLNKAQQDVLNPNGVNAFRFFEGRGNRLWGARTASSDPEWKYVNLRRYFAYLERSVERGTQWVVFENNHAPLWANVRRTVEDFLYNEWRQGHLMGDKPESAFFVRCDRSTMTQNDIDNGRLVCLVGVAPVRPAEFVIFRIGQWTGDHKA